MLSPRDFSYLRALVYQHSRIALSQSKFELVLSRISRRLRATGLSSPSAYCDYLRSPNGRSELPYLIDAISTNHTHFLRESSHFEYLRAPILRDWLKREKSPSSPFRAWSAACSSGEEPYTLSMTLDDALWTTQAQNHWSVLATDISHAILAQAQEAVYPAQALEQVPPTWKRRYFIRESSLAEEHWKVCTRIREKVLFHQINLLGPKVPSEKKFDLILCRNVMIYFDRPTQEELIRRLHTALKPGAYLMVGHSESLSGIRHGLLPVLPSIYRREL